MVAEPVERSLRREAAVLRPLDLARQVGERAEAVRRRQRAAIGSSSSAFDGRSCRAVAAEVAQLRERRGVERPRRDARGAERIEPRAHLGRRLVRERDGEDLAGSNAPVATWFATRRVIVVVLPEPAPARMQTGPRTASTARRCSGFSPAKTSSETTRPRLPGAQEGVCAGSVKARRRSRRRRLRDLRGRAPGSRSAGTGRLK